MFIKSRPASPDQPVHANGLRFTCAAQRSGVRWKRGLGTLLAVSIFYQTKILMFA